jgi:hypothetical protein
MHAGRGRVRVTEDPGHDPEGLEIGGDRERAAATTPPDGVPEPRSGGLRGHDVLMAEEYGAETLGIIEHVGRRYALRLMYNHGIIPPSGIYRLVAMDDEGNDVEVVPGFSGRHRDQSCFISEDRSDGEVLESARKWLEARAQLRREWLRQRRDAGDGA